MNQRQLDVIDYVGSENRVLREQLGERRLRLNDDQRRRLSAKAKRLGRSILKEVATIVKEVATIVKEVATIVTPDPRRSPKTGH